MAFSIRVRPTPSLFHRSSAMKTNSFLHTIQKGKGLIMISKPRLHAFHTAVTFVFAIGIQFQADGQPLPDLPFNSGSTGADGPLTFLIHVSPARDWYAMAYDATRQQTVLFGGAGVNGSGSVFAPVFDDVWTWPGENWTNQNPTAKPPGRYLHAMAYAAARGQVVLFGGIYNT